RKAAAVRRKPPIPGDHRQIRSLQRRPIRQARPYAARVGRRTRYVGGRRRFRWPAGSDSIAKGGDHQHPHRGKGGRFWRDLVLESLSWRPVRHRILYVPAAARGDRLHPQGEILLRPRDPGTCSADRQALPSVRAGLLSDADKRGTLGREGFAVDSYHRSWRFFRDAIYRDVERTAEPPQAPCNSGY